MMWDHNAIRGLLLLLCGMKCFVYSTNNCTLKILQNDIERTDFSCVQYNIPARDCRVPENPNLPIPDDDDGAIGTAENFESKVDRLVEEVSGVTWNLPKLLLSWNLPKAPSARTNLQGFMVDGVCADGTNCDKSEFCTVFDLRNSSFTSTDYNVKFKYTKVLNISNTFYHFKLFALPRTLTDGRLMVHHYRDISGYTNNAPSSDSRSWTTSVKIDITGNNVTVSFRYPVFNFTHYEIRLKHANNTVIMSKTNLRLQGSDEAVETFTNLETGTYFIDVLPLEQHREDDDNCQCYMFDGGRKYCVRCNYVETRNFNVTAQPAAIPSTSATTPSTITVPAETSESAHFTESSEQTTFEISTNPNVGTVLHPTDDDNSLTIGLSVGLSIVCIMGVLVLVYYMIKCRKGDEDIASLQEKSLFGQSQEVAIEEKTVFVLSADDHPHHLEAVKQLVMFLKEKCHCQVIYPPWEIKQMGSDTWRGWLHKSLDKADYILMVNSEASCNLLKASTSNKSYRYKVLTDSAHLFHEMLREILKEYKQLENVNNGVKTTTLPVGTDAANRLDIDKFLTVSFYYTPKEYYLTDFRINFELLQQLPNLVRYIHKLHANSPIPLDLNDVFTEVAEDDCKADLEIAVTKAGRFQKSDVLWFSERFGDAYRRETERHDSGYDEQDDVSRSRSTSQKSEKSTDELGFYPPSNLGDGESRVTAPDVPETMSYSNFSFIPPDAVSRGVSEFFPPQDTLEDDEICTISRQFRDINKHYNERNSTQV